MNNTENVGAWDAFVLVSTHFLNMDDEQTGQELAWAFFKSLEAEATTPQEYNDEPESTWEARVQAVAATVTRADTLSWADKLSACNLGGNYFEHGHDYIMSLISQENTSSVTKRSD